MKKQTFADSHHHSLLISQSFSAKLAVSPSISTCAVT